MSQYLPPPAYQGEPPVESLMAAECGRADKRIVYLDEIADMAMELARAQQRKALAQLEAEPDAVLVEGAPRERDAAAAFLNTARAVRVTLALQAKLQTGVNARRIELVYEQQLRGEARRKQSEFDDLVVQGEVEEIVAQVVEREAGDRGDAEDLVEDAREAVDTNWSDRCYRRKPVGAVVADVCRELGLEVDWSRWEDEDWAAREAEDGAEGSPFVKRDAPPGEPNDPGKPPDG